MTHRQLSAAEIKTTTQLGDHRFKEPSGFLVRIRESKRARRIVRTFYMNTKPAGQKKNVTVRIGDASLMSFSDARQKATEIRSQLDKGVNPNAERRKRAETEESARNEQKKQLVIQQLTLRKVFDDWTTLYSRPDLPEPNTKKGKLRKKKSPETLKGYRKIINAALSDWLDTPMTEITETMIKVRHQEELSDTPTTANRAMAVLSSMYSFSRKNYKDADNEPIIRHNPVSVLREMELLYDERPCKTYVNDEMKPAWYESITSLANKAAADLILLEYLCGSRHGETCRLRWENVDFNKRTFMLTGTKNGDDCLLPMSTQIEALLKRCRDRRSSEQEEWVFSAPTKLGHLDDIRETVQASRDRIGKSDWSEHDLRRTFKTCCEKVEISYITQKHLMNHSLRHNVTAGYDGREIETLRAALQKVDDKLMELATVAAKPD